MNEEQCKRNHTCLVLVTKIDHLEKENEKLEQKLNSAIEVIEDFVAESSAGREDIRLSYLFDVHISKKLINDASKVIKENKAL